MSDNWFPKTLIDSAQRTSILHKLDIDSAQYPLFHVANQTLSLSINSLQFIYSFFPGRISCSFLCFSFCIELLSFVFVLKRHK